jgi:4-hydroxy-tetrahydrodipicolinate reductase
MKVDAPSGTRCCWARRRRAGVEVRLADVAVRGRDGITGACPADDIGFAALRGGSVAGDQR